MNKQFTRVSLFIGLLLALSAFSASATEVVYGLSDHTLPCSHWGWYIPTTTFPVSGNLIAGDSSGLVGNGIDAGTYLIEKVGSEIVVTYTLTPPFSLTDVDIYAKCIDP